MIPTTDVGGRGRVRVHVWCGRGEGLVVHTLGFGVSKTKAVLIFGPVRTLEYEPIAFHYHFRSARLIWLATP